MLDIKEYFCPHSSCKCYGLRGYGNLVKAGTYRRKVSGEKKQVFKCIVCGTRFSETQSTIFAGSHYSDQTIKSIILCTAEGNGIRATSRILGLSKDRVNQIVLKAGIYADMMLSNLLQSLHLNECQIDELWSFVQKKKALDEKELKAQYGQTWVWAALDSNSRLIICHLVGNRTLESCRLFLKELSSRLANIPLFTSDELVHYETVLGEIYSEEIPVEPTGMRGRPRNPEREINPQLDYAVVHKTREKRKLVKVERRVVYGDEKRIDEKLAQSPGKKINTSYIERVNGTLRQTDSHLRRKSQTFAKEMPHFKAKLSVVILMYNCIRPHSTLSKNPDKSCTPRTPALVAKLIEKNWTVDSAFKKPLLL